MYSYYVPPTAGTPWRPCWSPDGKEIAFSMSGSIWKIKLGETVAHELTANATYDSAPAWSPDGRWITYTAEDSQGVNLMLLNVATGESSHLTTGDRLNLDPVWSPDGSKIGFVRNEPGNQFHIYYMPFEGGRAGNMVQLTNQNSFGRARLYFNQNDDHIQPTWSPDGKEMILVSNRNIPLGSGALWRMPAEPDGMRKATMILREETLYRTRPRWSHDGKRVFYSSHRAASTTTFMCCLLRAASLTNLPSAIGTTLTRLYRPIASGSPTSRIRPGYSELRVLRTYGGEDDPVRIQQRIYRRSMGKLQVQLRDSDGPVAARVYLMASDGKTYAPEHAYQRMSAKSVYGDYFHAKGQFFVDLPPGKVRVEAVRGIEFQPAIQEAEIRPGAVTTIRLEPKRIAHPNASGWYSGSDHIHMNYGGNLHNTPENLMMLAEAEWLNMIGEKVANKDHRIFDHQHFTAAPHKLSTATQLLSFGEEYRPPFYGHINFINMKHLISPFTTGYEGSGIESLYPEQYGYLSIGRRAGGDRRVRSPLVLGSGTRRVCRGARFSGRSGARLVHLPGGTDAESAFHVHGSGLASCAELRIQSHRIRWGRLDPESERDAGDGNWARICLPGIGSFVGRVDGCDPQRPDVRHQWPAVAVPGEWGNTRRRDSPAGCGRVCECRGAT